MPAPAPIPLTRPAVAALVADAAPSARSLEAILAADDRGDHDEACARALARVVAGDELPAAAMARLFVFAPEYAVAMGLAGIATGERGAALLEMIERDRFHGDPEGLTVAMYAIVRIGVAPALRGRLIAQARRLTRARLDVGALLVLDAVVEALGDPHLSGLAVDGRGLAAEATGRATLARLDAGLASSAARIVEELPERAEQTAAPAGFTVRSGPKPGRNDPCPCGSGQKYKKCCADKAPAVTPSPIAGMSWEQFLGDGAGRLTSEDVDRLELSDLARVDLTRLADLPLIGALRRATSWRSWALVERVLAAMDLRPVVGRETADAWRGETITQLLMCGEVERARAELARLGDRSQVPEQDLLLLAMLERPGLVAPELTAAALRALEDPTGIDAIDLAHTLMHGAPALGVLIARGCLQPERLLESETLLEVVEEARDDLGLPPGDPAWQRFDEMAAAHDEEDVDDSEDDEDEPDAEAEQLRAELQTASARLAELEAQQKTERRALARRAPAITTEPDAREVAERRDLRDKLELLQQRIREGNEERAALRRKLAEAARQERGGDVAPPPPPVADEPDEPGEAAAPPRRPLVPRFERRAEDALQSVPAQAASEALRTLGMLAAGDAAAWRGVKQAKDMTRPVLMARVGIHHRLLFVLEDRILLVLELVTREELLHTLKRLRS